MAKTRKVGQRRTFVKKHKSRRKAKGKAYNEAVSALLSKKLNDVHSRTYGQEFFDPGDPSLVSKIVSQLHDTNDTICEICLKSMRNNGSVVELGCTHKFHAKCLKNQIESGDTTCSICRTPMTDKEIESILAKRRIRTEKQAKRLEEIKEYEQFRPPERPSLVQSASLPDFIIYQILYEGWSPTSLVDHIVYSMQQIELLEDEIRKYRLQILNEPLLPQIPNISLKEALVNEERMTDIVSKMRKFRAQAHFIYNLINTNSNLSLKFKNMVHDHLSTIEEEVIRMKGKTDELLLLALDNKRDAEQISRRVRVSRQSRDITRNIM